MSVGTHAPTTRHRCRCRVRAPGPERIRPNSANQGATCARRSPYLLRKRSDGSEVGQVEPAFSGQEKFPPRRRAWSRRVRPARPGQRHFCGHQPGRSASIMAIFTRYLFIVTVKTTPASYVRSRSEGSLQCRAGIYHVRPVVLSHEYDPMPEWSPLLQVPLNGQQRVIRQTRPRGETAAVFVRLAGRTAPTGLAHILSRDHSFRSEATMPKDFATAFARAWDTPASAAAAAMPQPVRSS